MINIDTNVVSAIISAASALLGAMIGGRYAYKGSMAGVTKQIEEQRRQLDEEKREKEKLAEAIVMTFLLHESRHNYMLIHGLFDERIINSDTPFQHGYNKLDLKFDEYNKIKYDLIKFESRIMKELIELYQYFMLIDSKKDINQLTTGDYHHFKKIYMEYKPIFN